MTTPDKIMDHTIKQLKAIFPAWHQAMRTEDEEQNLKYTWAKAFFEAGIGIDDIRRGLKRAARHPDKWMPSCGEFISWCMPAGEPTAAQAYQQAAMGRYVSPEALEAAKRTGEYDLRNNPNRELRRLFEDHYRDVLNEKREGKVFMLPKPDKKPEQLEYQSEITEAESKTQAYGRATFAQLKAMLSDTAEEKTNVDTNLEP